VNAPARPGRNEPCACGSGRKYKHCCAREAAPPAADAAPGADDLRALISLARAGRHAELGARAQELLRLHPASGFLWKALSVARQAQGEDARESLEKAAALLPHDPEAHSNLGTALRAAGQLGQAEACFRRALERNPGVAEVWNNLGRVLADAGRLEEAVAAHRRCLELKPGYVEAYCALGMALRTLGRSGDAMQTCQRALEIAPRHAAAWAFLGELYSDSGAFDAAEQHYRRALELDGRSVEALSGLVRVRRMGAGDEGWLERAQALLRTGLGSRAQAYLRYAMGKYFDDVGEWGAAFEQYARANELSKGQRAGHDRAQVQQGIERIIERFDEGWLRAHEAVGSGGERAVLIVGMPRSGTTLAEQILAAHPQVHGAGELSYWSEAAAGYVIGQSDEGRVLEELGRGYVRVLEGLSSEARRVVDKMPGNFLYLGLIRAALPQARIIHMRRHPIDTCLSIYFQNFGALHTYANDLEDLQHYYRQYLRLMAHWRALIPEGVMLEVSYEDLVREPERWSRRMLEHVGLGWDARCLEFHASERTVTTFSKWQARQRISTASIERWRHYQPFIAPLMSLVEPS